MSDTLCPCCRQTRLLVRGPPERLCLSCAQLERPRPDVDLVVVQRLLSGSVVESTRAERQAAVAELDALQLSASQIARRLHLSKRTVERLRARTAA